MSEIGKALVDIEYCVPCGYGNLASWAVSEMFAAGRYNDTIDMSGNRPLLRTREVRLDTRDLGGGTHFPI